MISNYCMETIHKLLLLHKPKNTLGLQPDSKKKKSPHKSTHVTLSSYINIFSQSLFPFNK